MALTVFICSQMKAQYLMDMMDTTKDMGKGMLAIYNRFDNIKFSGYIQPQFQVAESKGAKTYSGGDFASISDAIGFPSPPSAFWFDFLNFLNSLKFPINE